MLYLASSNCLAFNFHSVISWMTHTPPSTFPCSSLLGKQFVCIVPSIPVSGILNWLSFSILDSELSFVNMYLYNFKIKYTHLLLELNWKPHDCSCIEKMEIIFHMFSQWHIRHISQLFWSLLGWTWWFHVWYIITVKDYFNLLLLLSLLSLCSDTKCDNSITAVSHNKINKIILFHTLLDFVLKNINKHFCKSMIIK